MYTGRIQGAHLKEALQKEHKKMQTRNGTPPTLQIKQGHGVLPYVHANPRREIKKKREF